MGAFCQLLSAVSLGPVSASRWTLLTEASFVHSFIPSASAWRPCWGADLHLTWGVQL